MENQAMAANIENRLTRNTLVSIEKPRNYIFQQCLNVVTTFPEFSNLTYRVSRTSKDLEVMTICRDRLLGVFGPPLDPITLTIDPNGRCLVSILFKPVRRVSLVSGNTGGLDVLSLLAVLRMIAGKGFLFCPGIPEKLLLGRPCGRYVESHRAPFKRFQSPQCPVYYQMKEESEKESKPNPIFKMCPQCRQVATIVLRLPPVAQSPRPQNLVDLEKLTSDTSDSESQYHSVPGQMKYVISRCDDKRDSEQVRILPPPLLSLPADIGRSVPSSGLNDEPISQNHVESSSSNAVPSLKRSSSEPRGQRFAEDTLTPLLSARSPATAKALRNVLLQKRLKLDFPNSQDKVAGKKNKNKKINNRNVCRICKKLFSSPANLLNHIQRHEGFNGSLSKHLAAKFSSRKQNSASVLMRMVLRGAKTHAGIKKSPAVSGTSLRLFMRCLHNLISDQNSSNSINRKNIHGQVKRTGKGLKNEKQKVEKNVPVKTKTTESVERPSLSRSSSGLSPMQTLLEAAVMAGSNSNNFSSIDDAETASYNFSPHPKLTSAGLEGPETKSRKSPRIASRLKKKEQEKSVSSYALSVARPIATLPEKLTEPGHLTNLDLLSSVSLDMEKRKPNFPSSASVPSQHVTISNTLLRMPSQSNSVDSKYGGPPPLLFAQPGKDGKLLVSHSSSKQVLSRVIPQPVTDFSESMVADTQVSREKGLSPGCGAIDLTKPKFLNQVVLPGLISVLDQTDKASALPASKFPKTLVGSKSDNIPISVLINSGGTCQQQIPNQSLIPRLPGMISMNKVSDVSLQNRMYASARDYKLDKKSLAQGPQIHAMVASHGTASKPGSDEIQCGYKWSGSGGQVKERTQMVRELVPQDVMATYLNKQFMQPPSPLPTAQVQPQISLQPNLPEPKGPRHLPQPAIGATRAFLPQHLKSLPKFPVPSSPVDEASSQVALNLTTAKPNHIEASPKAKSATRPKRQYKKGGQAGQAQAPVNIPEAEVSSPPVVSNRIESGGQSCHLQGSGVKVSCTFSSPSLAAILQDKKEPSSSVAAILKQPTVTSSNNACVKASIKKSTPALSLNNGNRPNSNNLSSAHREKQVKLEAPCTVSPNDDECIILSLPVKSERIRSQSKEQQREREGSASPGNLVVDLQNDSTPADFRKRHPEVKQEAPQS